MASANITEARTNAAAKLRTITKTSTGDRIRAALRKVEDIEKERVQLNEQSVVHQEQATGYSKQATNKAALLVTAIAELDSLLASL